MKSLLFLPGNEITVPSWLLRLGGIFASALLVITSAQSNHLALLALVWMLPLLYAIKGSSPIQAAILSGFCALLFWAGSIWWLLPASLAFSHAIVAVAICVYLLSCCWLAFPYALFAYVYNRFNLTSSIAGCWTASAILTILLVLIPSPIPGLPLHALHIYPRLLAIIDLSGMSTAIFAFTLFQLLIWKTLDGHAGTRRLAFVQLLLLAFLVSGYGIFRNHQYQYEKSHSSPEQWLHTAFIQPNLHRQDNLQSLFSLSEKLLQKSKPDLLVWPEFPPAFSIIDNKVNRRDTLAFSKDHQTPLLVVSGYVYARQNNHIDRQHYYSAAHLIDNGTVSGTYYKQRLVPFFEYLPGRLQFPALAAGFPHALNYLAGHSNTPLHYSSYIHIIPAICYEAIFPSLVNKMVNEGGNILINPVSDTWFGNSPGSRYHVSLAHFRSMEHHIPWLRVANSGISMAVEANGDIITSSTTAMGVQAVQQQSLFIPAKRSLYSHLGDWLTPFLCIVVAFSIHRRRFNTFPFSS